MTILTIQISDKDRDLFEKLAKRLNAKILEVVEENLQPNVAKKRLFQMSDWEKSKKLTPLICSSRLFNVYPKFYK